MGSRCEESGQLRRPDRCRPPRFLGLVIVCPAVDTPGQFHYISSTEFQQLDPRAQFVTRRILESIYLEPIAPGAKETFGDCPVADFGAKAVGIVRDRKRNHPEAAFRDRKRPVSSPYCGVCFGLFGPFCTPADNRDI
jgi:hypothetical protein